MALRTNKLLSAGRRYRRPIVMLVHLAVVIVVYCASFLLRYDFRLPEASLALLVQTLPLLVVARMGTLGVFHLFQGLWRYVSVRDVLQIIKATTAGSLIFVPLAVLVSGGNGIPASIFILDWAGNLLALAGVRILGQLIREAFRPSRRSDTGAKRLLIVGAGEAGAALCREAQSRSAIGLLPIGFIDDDPWKAGASLLGAPILGNRNDIPRVVAEHRADTIVIAIPSASREQMRGIVEQCRLAAVPFRTLPSMSSILDGRVSIDMLRDVEIADLLGREAVQLDREAMGKLLQSRRVLITGAAGSIGSELARQIAIFQPELLVLIDRAENPLFYVEADFQQRFPGLQFVAEARDTSVLSVAQDLMKTYRPQVVFHAAAHKHVPLMERTPAEAVRNNVLGSYHVAQAAQENGVERLVLISTDKAVKPTSVMGATKRVAELLMQAMSRKSTTKLISVRFGNVLGSNASVVPIFKEQIAKGGPVTVTHPEAQRYFMTASEAAQLVLQAGAIGTGGEVFVLDMGQPVRIVDLARDLISLSGHTPDKDVKIIYTGLRPGEKVFEELNFEGENLLPTSHPKVRALRGSAPSIDLETQVAQLATDLPGLTPSQVKERLQALVPEYSPSPLTAAHISL